MLRHVTWADALFIQAAANAFNLIIYIKESIPGFASITNISPVSSETDTTVINIEKTRKDLSLDVSGSS